MIGLLRLFTNNFASKKLGIAETTKVIQEKILSITQVVIFVRFRMILKNLELSSVLVMESPEFSDLTKSKPERWSNLDQESAEWLSI
jgi:hypothetical protein